MIGLQAGLRGKAQIGKGVHVVKTRYAFTFMYKTKIEHPEDSGASCAWVPSPSGAVKRRFTRS